MHHLLLYWATMLRPDFDQLNICTCIGYMYPFKDCTHYWYFCKQSMNRHKWPKYNLKMKRFKVFHETNLPYDIIQAEALSFWKRGQHLPCDNSYLNIFPEMNNWPWPDHFPAPWIYAPCKSSVGTLLELGSNHNNLFLLP